MASSGTLLEEETEEEQQEKDKKKKRSKPPFDGTTFDRVFGQKFRGRKFWYKRRGRKL